MDKYNNNLALLGEILDMDCSHMTTEDMRKILNTELDKPADMGLSQKDLKRSI